MPADKGYPWGEIRIALISGFMTQEEASIAYEVPLGTIAARCAREKWLQRPEKAAVTTESKSAVSAGSGVQKSIAVAQEHAAGMKDELRNLGAKVARKGLRALADDEINGAAIVGMSKNVKDLVDVAAKVCGFDTPENQTILNIGFLNDDQEPVVVLPG